MDRYGGARESAEWRFLRMRRGVCVSECGQMASEMESLSACLDELDTEHSVSTDSVGRFAAIMHLDLEVAAAIVRDCRTPPNMQTTVLMPQTVEGWAVFTFVWRALIAVEQHSDANTLLAVFENVVTVSHAWDIDAATEGIVSVALIAVCGAYSLLPAGTPQPGVRPWPFFGRSNSIALITVLLGMLCSPKLKTASQPVIDAFLERLTEGDRDLNRRVCRRGDHGAILAGMFGALRYRSGEIPLESLKEVTRTRLAHASHKTRTRLTQDSRAIGRNSFSSRGTTRRSTCPAPTQSLLGGSGWWTRSSRAQSPRFGTVP